MKGHYADLVYCHPYISHLLTHTYLVLSSTLVTLLLAFSVYNSNYELQH
jgi:hypothetical protein